MSRPFASLTRSFAKGTPTAPVPAQVSVLLRVVVELLAGAAVGLSWQPYGLWPLLLVGIPAFTLATRAVELCAHTVDLQLATGQPPAVPATAAAIAVAVLTPLADPAVLLRSLLGRAPLPDGFNVLG